jgi:hypothetical protein
MITQNNIMTIILNGGCAINSDKAGNPVEQQPTQKVSTNTESKTAKLILLDSLLQEFFFGV